jgi:hypothetical protein
VKQIFLLALAAALSAAPDIATAGEMHALGSVYIDSGSTSVQYRDAFPAPVERIRFHAAHGEPTCDFVRATFADGPQRELLRGVISGAGAEVVVPDNMGAIQRLEFSCQPRLTLTEIAIDADLGRFETAWRQSPEWPTKWWYRIDPTGSAPVRPDLQVSR